MLIRFVVRPAICEIKDSRKSKMHGMTSVKGIVNTLNTYPRDQNSLYGQVFSRYKSSKIGNALNNFRPTLSSLLSKTPCLHWKLTPETQISLCFALLWFCFEVIVVLGFPIWHNRESKNAAKIIKKYKTQKSITLCIQWFWLVLWRTAESIKQNYYVCRAIAVHFRHCV